MSKTTVNAALSALVTEGIIAAKQHEGSKFSSTKWILKDIGVECRKHLKGSVQYQDLVQDQYQNLVQEVSQEDGLLYQNLTHPVPESGTKIEEGNREEERESLSSSKTQKIEPTLTQISSQKQTPISREERLRRAEYLVCAVVGPIAEVPNSTWGYVNKQLKALEWPDQDSLQGFVNWWREEHPEIRLTLGAVSPKNWATYFAAKMNTVQKYQPRRWTED